MKEKVVQDAKVRVSWIIWLAKVVEEVVCCRDSGLER